MSEDLTTFFQTLLEQAKDRHDKDLDPDVARSLLASALAAWDAPNPFKRGDFVRVANHASVWRKSLGLCIVLRVHEREEEVDEDQHRALSWNMRILALGGNGAAHELQAHSRDFELASDA